MVAGGGGNFEAIALIQSELQSIGRCFIIIYGLGGTYGQPDSVYEEHL